MKFSMTGQEKSDSLVEMTHVRFNCRYLDWLEG
jgi:hypothetical protein